MAFLGIIVIFLVVWWVLKEIETNRQLKKKDIENVWNNFKNEMLEYAKTNKKIAKGYVVDSETEGGQWAQITSTADENKVLGIIAEYKNQLNRYSFQENDKLKSLARRRINSLPERPQNGYVR